MFCKKANSTFGMSCLEKGISEFFSFISLICSIFLITITLIKIKMNIMYKLIIHIIISEIIDEINVLLAIVFDGIGQPTFENYNSRMMVCFTQIYLGVFTCLWTLTASLFISLKLYDIIVNKNKIFKDGSFMSKYTCLISMGGPMILSFLIWSISVNIQSYDNKKVNIYGNKSQHIKEGKQKFRMIFCWVDTSMSILLFVIVSFLIAGNIYFSLIKGYFFVKKTKEDLKENNDESSPNIKKQISNMNQIQNTLFLYPIISCILWSIFFLFKLIFRFLSKTNSVLSFLFCLFISIRQISYILVYFLSQQKLKEYSILVLTCKIWKNKKRQNLVPLEKSVKEVEPILENDK